MSNALGHYANECPKRSGYSKGRYPVPLFQIRLPRLTPKRSAFITRHGQFGIYYATRSMSPVNTGQTNLSNVTSNTMHQSANLFQLTKISNQADNPADRHAVSLSHSWTMAPKYGFPWNSRVPNARWFSWSTVALRYLSSIDALCIRNDGNLTTRWNTHIGNDVLMPPTKRCRFSKS